ncbi:MAG TPA: VOC family protein [Candidatus Sulfotelmatobacter sp.]|nr:VOC family protein [Candidatus Sulfotelmatobacter sp.]
MNQSIADALVVRDYDEAIAFFTQSLGFDLIEDSISTDRTGQKKRWVLVAPSGVHGTTLLLAKASTLEEGEVHREPDGRTSLSFSAH